MSKLKIIAVMLVLMVIVIMPTAFAEENQTTVELADDSDAISSDYYFDAGAVNDTGNGTKDSPRATEQKTVHIRN